MITWIQRTFERHTKAVIVFLLLVITIPFVFTIGAAPGIGQGGSKVKEQPYFGYNLNSQEDLRRISADTQLSLLLQAVPGQNAEQIQTVALQRIAALHLARSYNIPLPTDEQLNVYVTTLPAFRDEQGNFSASHYAKFEDQVRTSNRLMATQVRRVMGEDWSIEKLREVLAGPGYVQSEDARRFYNQSFTEWSIQIAEFSIATYAPQISANNSVLSTFFTENEFRYEVPPRVSVDYISFDLATFPQVAPTDEEALAFYKANKERFPKDGADKADVALPALEDIAADFAIVRAKVLEALKQENALRAAGSAASEFTVQLFEKKIARDSAEFNALVTQYKGRRATAPDFTNRASPAGLNWSRAVVNTAHALDAERYFTDAINVEGTPTVLIWKETKPGYKPAFEEVKNDVLSDYMRDAKRKQLTQSGAVWKTEIAASLAAGKTLTQALGKLENAPSYTLQSPAAFSLRNPPKDIPYPVYGLFATASQGMLSDLILAGEKAYFVHFASSKVPVLDVNNKDYASALAALRNFSKTSTENAVLERYIEAELPKNTERN